MHVCTIYTLYFTCSETLIWLILECCTLWPELPPRDTTVSLRLSVGNSRWVELSDWHYMYMYIYMYIYLHLLHVYMYICVHFVHLYMHRCTYNIDNSWWVELSDCQYMYMYIYLYYMHILYMHGCTYNMDCNIHVNVHVYWERNCNWMHIHVHVLWPLMNSGSQPFL